MKKILSVFLTVLVLVGITACGQKTSEGAWQEQYDLGVRYLSEGKYEEAIIAFTAAIEIDEKQPLAFIGRADAYIGSGESSETLASALADYEAAVGLDETNADAWLGLADVYIRQGDLVKAQEVLEQALSKISDSQKLTDKLDEINSGSVTDSSGQSRMMISYDGDNNIMFWHTYTYDSEGRKASVSSFAPDGTKTGYVECAYTPSGKMLSSYSWSSDTGEVSKFEYVLDSNEYTIKMVSYDETGAVTTYFLLENDENGQPVKEEQYSADGTLRRYTVYSDHNGVHREEDYDPDNHLESYVEWTEDGTYYYSGDGTLEFYEISIYDDAGNYIGEEEYDGNGNLISRRVYQ